MRPGTSPYTVLRRLGNGGMADVFLAQDTSRGGRLVALKRIRVSTPEMLLHFTREARAGVLLSHPHVVRVEDAGLDEQGPFLALEFVDGVSASDLLSFFAQQRSALPLELWCVLARDVAAGLHYAHSAPLRGGARGVLHRDISPDNVLVSLEGVAKLSDFGLAYMAEDTRVTSTGSVKGKVAYLAPELFESAAPSIASDVYALGVLLFRMASGLMPFRGNNEGELILNILHGERPALSALRPDLPGPLAQWVHHAMDRQAGERPGLDRLLTLLPPDRQEDASRLALAKAVREARDKAAALPGFPWSTARQTQRLSPPASGTQEVRFEATERVPSAEPGPGGPAGEPTEPLPSLGAMTQGLGMEPTEPLPALSVPPPAAAREPAGRLAPPLSFPQGTRDEPTEFLSQALPRQAPLAVRTPPAVPPPAPARMGRAWRGGAWLFWGVVLLVLMGLLAANLG
jgi:eukaryotic-like serine/threonine-protein kinase